MRFASSLSLSLYSFSSTLFPLSSSNFLSPFLFYLPRLRSLHLSIPFTNQRPLSGFVLRIFSGFRSLCLHYISMIARLFQTYLNSISTFDIAVAMNSIDIEPWLSYNFPLFDFTCEIIKRISKIEIPNE